MRGLRTLGVTLGMAASAPASGMAVGAYSLWTRGPVKSLALSGATIASTDNSAAVLENPAGIGHQPGVFRWTFDYGSPHDDSVIQPAADHFRERYLIVGCSLLLWNTVGFGVGAEAQTYETSGAPDPDTRFAYEDVVLDGHMSLAVKLSRSLSLSGTYVRNVSRRAAETRAGGVLESASGLLEGSQLRYGLLWRISQKLSVGAAHSRPSVLRPRGQAVDPYGFAYKPEQNRLGLSFDFKPGHEKAEGMFPEDVKLFAQLDLLRFPGVPGAEGLYYAPAIAFLDRTDFRLEDGKRWIPRLAGETTVFRYDPVALRFWSGAYVEPAYLRGRASRAHATAGAHLKVYMVVLQAALDLAKDFRNRNFGASLELGF